MKSPDVAGVARLIGVLRPWAIQSLSSIFLAPSRRYITSSLRDLETSTDGIVVAAAALGIDIDRKLIVPSKVTFLKFSDYFFENAMLRDSIAELIDATYGATARFNFVFTQIVSVIHILSSGYQHMRDDAVPRTKHGRRMIQQRKVALDAFGTFCRFLSENDEAIAAEIGPTIAEATRALRQCLAEPSATPRFFRAVYQRTSPILNLAVPQYDSIQTTLDRGRMLLKQLRSCPAGRSGWRRFEQVVVDILRLLFVPPFRKILVQTRTGSGHEIRDAVLPNNHYTGFWSLIRQEFESKHIICEMKNNRSPITKADLHQLRIYLSKPTIGRFGLLIHRGEASASALEARRSAYEQSQILIILANEAILEQMLKSRAYLGEPDIALEDLKADFELSY